MAKFKRYDSYKNSGVEWLGEIPSHWEMKSLKYCLKFTIGVTPSSSEESYYFEEEPWITISDMSGKHITKTHFVSKKAVKKCNMRVVPKGSLLYSFKLSVGQVSFTTKDAYTNEAIASFYPTNNTNLKFWYYVLPVYLIRNANKNIYGVYLLNQDLIKNAMIIFPPKDEQKKIASYLDEKIAKINTAISGKEKLIELLKEQKQIIINDAVTKGLNKNAKFKNSGIEWLGKIPSHWDVKRFKDYFKFDKGLTITKENLQDEGIFCVNYGEIHSKLGFEVNPKIDNLKCVGKEYLKANQKSLVKNGDFIFADTSEDIEGAGNFTYLNSCLPTFAGYHTIICRPKKNLASRYLAYEFQSTTFRSQIQKRVKGVKVYSITQGLLADLIIWLPPKDEQEKIVSYLDEKISKIDKLINLEQEYIKSLKEYKASLIDSVVTGKVKV